jgi:hypothetical protein
MKQKNQDIEQEIEKTLACLDQAERIEPSPWFVTRLQARIHALEGAPERPGLSAWAHLLLKPALLALMVVLNGATVFVAVQSHNSGQEGRLQNVAILASDYGITYTDAFFNVDEEYQE